MSLSGFATLTTIITPIIPSITVAIITVIFTEYIRRRISSTRSQKFFLTALKDYDNDFSNDYNTVKRRIEYSLIGLSIGGIIAVLLAIIYSYALNSLFINIFLVIAGIIILRIVVYKVVYGITSITSIIKNSRQAYIAKAVALGIFNDTTASLFVSIFAFLFLLSLLQSRHEIFIQDNLEMLFIFLISSLILTYYFPTVLIRLDSDDISSNKTTSWEFMLVNLQISDLKTSFWLTVKLNYCHKATGKLLQVNNFGIILEKVGYKEAIAGKPVKNYVPWQEVVSIEIVKM